MGTAEVLFGPYVKEQNLCLERPWQGTIRAFVTFGFDMIHNDLQERLNSENYLIEQRTILHIKIKLSSNTMEIFKTRNRKSLEHPSQVVNVISTRSQHRFRMSIIPPCAQYAIIVIFRRMITH